jgi:hypothetical protein
MATGRPPADSTDRMPEQPGARVSSRSRTSRTVAGRAKRSSRPVRRYWADFQRIRVSRDWRSWMSNWNRTAPSSRSSLRRLRPMAVMLCRKARRRSWSQAS